MLQNITKCTALRDGDRNFKKELAECKSELAKFKVENSNLILEISKTKADKSDRNFRRELAHCKKILFQKGKEIRELNDIVESKNVNIEDLTGKLNTAFQENNGLLEANNSQIKRIEIFEKEAGEFEKTIQQVSEENCKLKKHVEEIDQCIRHASEENGRLVGELKQTIRHVKEKNGQLKKQAEERERTIRNATEENSQLKKQTEEIGRTIRPTSEENIRLKKQVGELEKNICHVKDKNGQLNNSAEKMNRRIRNGTEENNQLKTQVSKMNDEINSMKMEINKSSFKVPNTAYARNASNDQNACPKCDMATDLVGALLRVFAEETSLDTQRCNGNFKERHAPRASHKLKKIKLKPFPLTFPNIPIKILRGFLNITDDQFHDRLDSLCTKGYFGKYQTNITNTLAITEKFIINFTASNYTDKQYMYPISLCIKPNDGDFVTSRYTGEIVHFEAPRKRPGSYYT